MSDRARFLHVANGTSTTSTIEAAGIPGTCSIWADPLHEGPVPGGLSDSELIEVRRQFLARPDGPCASGLGADRIPLAIRSTIYVSGVTVIARHESVRRADSVVRTRRVRSIEPDSVARLDSRTPSVDKAGVAHLHRVVPGTSRFQRPWRTDARRTGAALRPTTACRGQPVRSSGTRVAGVPVADARGARFAPARGHVSHAVPRPCRQPFSRGVSVDAGRIVADRAATARVGRRRRRPIAAGVPSHARR